MTAIIIDTDIGTDFDDAMAISLAMYAPGLDIKGITTVYGNTSIRAQLAKKLTQLGRCANIPIYAGLEQTLLLNRQIAWIGHEGEGVLDEEEVVYESGSAVDFIISTVMENPGQITLVPIGPLTNIAAAIIHEPRIIQNVKEIVMMGGYARTGALPEFVNPCDWNIICDPEAASVVFRSGIPITMVGLDVTYWVSVSRDEFKRQLAMDNPLHNALHELLQRWLAHLNKETAFMHDPLTVAVVMDRSIVTTKKMRIEVEYDQRQKAGTTIATPDDHGNVDVCCEVDIERFKKLLFSTIQNAD